MFERRRCARTAALYARTAGLYARTAHAWLSRRGDAVSAEVDDFEAAAADADGTVHA